MAGDERIFNGKLEALDYEELKEQCEVLKSQIIVYKQDFEKKRIERELLLREKQNYKLKVQDCEETIRQLTTALDAHTARGGLHQENDGSDSMTDHQAQYLNPGCPFMCFVVEEL